MSPPITVSSAVTSALESTRQTSFVEGALRGSALTMAVLAYIAAEHGAGVLARVMGAAHSLTGADALAAIIVNHASSSPGIDALQACAAEVLAWVERGN